MSEKLQTIKNSTIKKGSVSTQVILILISCLAAAFLQGCGFLSLSHYDQILILTCIFLAYFALLYYLKVSKRLIHEDTVVTMMIFLGVLLRFSYILLSGLYDRQHDAGVYTGMGTDFVNRLY